MSKLNEQLKLLVDLQEIDSSIISIEEQIESLPLILKQFTPQLQAAKDAFQKYKTKHEVLTKKKKDKDLKLDEIQDKIDKFKSRNSEIKTNKEYEAHLKEIENFEKSRYAIEDEILSLMEGIEEYLKETKEEEKKLKKAEEVFSQKEKEVNEEEKKLDLELQAQKAKKNDFITRIDKDIYKIYNNLLERFGGGSVVRTEDEVCLGCNTNIPPQLYNDIRKNDGIYHCFYCKRVLYYKEPSPSDNNPQEKKKTP